MFWDKETERYLLHRLKVLRYSVQCPEREKPAQQNGHKIHFCKEDRKCFCQEPPPQPKTTPKKQTKKPHQSLWYIFPIWRNKVSQISPLSQTTYLKTSPVPCGSSFRARAGHCALGPSAVRLWDRLPALHVLGQFWHLNQGRAIKSNSSELAIRSWII